MLRSLLSVLPFVAATGLLAAEAPPKMLSYIDGDLRSWVNDDRVVAAVKAQNAQTAALTQEEVIAKDNAWRAEVGTTNTPMIDVVLSAPLSEFLREQVASSGGRITEAFVMDSQGLNVAASGITSDYWQGDEDKFIKTFGKGADAVFIDEVELDESTQTYQGQVSFTITDPESGAVIGAITIGLDASAFF